MSGPLAVWQPNLPDGSYKILVHAVMWKLLYSRILSQLFEGGRVPSNMYSRTEPLEISLQVDSEFLVWRGGGYLKKFETIKAVPTIVVVFSYIYKYMLKELEKNILAEGPSPEIKSCSTSMCHMIWQKCQELYKYGKQANHNDHMNWPSNCLTSLD